MQLRNHETGKVANTANLTNNNNRKQNMGSDIPEVSANEISGKNLRNRKVTVNSEPTKPKSNTHREQPVIAETLDFPADEATSLSLEKAKAKLRNALEAHRDKSKIHGNTTDSSADEAPALALKTFKVKPINTSKADSVKEAAKHRQLTSKISDSSADEALAPNIKMAKAKPTNTSKAPPTKTVSKQQKASGKASSHSADQAPAVEPTKAGSSKMIAQKEKVSSSELSSLDDVDISIADPTDAGADAASPSTSEQVSGGEDGSEEGDEENKEYSEEEHDEDEAGEVFRAARFEAEAESITSSEKSMASDAGFGSDGESHPDNKKKETFKADDASAFASSMSAILGNKLTTTQRANPILARSADAKEADEALLDLKLGRKAKTEIRRKHQEKLLKEIHGEGAGDMVGSIADIEDPEDYGTVFAYQQREKGLRKTAEKGVVKMFNAFTHVRGKTVEAKGMVGSRAQKEGKATEMTKEGWLDYVGQGGEGTTEEEGLGKVAGENSLSELGEEDKIEKQSELGKKGESGPKGKLGKKRAWEEE
ncbi:hypothetical protein HO173_007766 [Letharia columbiana]|uniref:Uncharacterized protein n=1 Tax=Letharia columbiana TaxID=112416 RepID=A0A8H6L3A8_9LECA|nr:uncharacterized protein HO173_007766 [Letharia columbiana]KAF6233936.1 hypothetical protein HO173_007766 [Letharia columbiana]